MVVFVYFKANPDDDQRVAAQLGRLQAAIRARLGADASTRFGHRRQEAPGQRTWLESYELPPAADATGLLALRNELAAAAGLDALLVAPAHVEVFEMQGDAPCA